MFLKGMVVNGDFIIYVNKINIDQALEALETTYNSIENKTPLLLPKISTSPYPTLIMDNFSLKSTTTTNLEKANCKLCDKEVDILYMRSHVAVHILKGDTTGQVCGACGIMHTGNVRKIVTKNKAFKAIVEDCTYFKSFNYGSVVKVTKSNPSSNRPEHCVICKSCMWSYNMILHYQEIHHDVPCPDIFMKGEREAVLSFTI